MYGKKCGLNYLSAAKHFMNEGIGKLKAGSEEFDVNYYMNNNKDLKDMYGTSSPINYFIYHTWKGWMEDRECSLYDE